MRKKTKSMWLPALLAGFVILSVKPGISFASVSGNDAASLEKSVKATPSEASKIDEKVPSDAVGKEKETVTGSKSVEWKVRPLKVGVSVGDIIKTYDGTADLPADAKIEFVSSDGYNGAIISLVRSTDYEVLNAHYDSADASEEEKTISFTIKLKNEGYVFEDGKTQKDFTLNGSETGSTFKITKADAPTAAAGSLTIINGQHKKYSLELSTLLPELAAPSDYGTVTYGRPDTDLGIGTFLTLVDSRNATLTLEVFQRNSDEEGQFGIIKVPVTTENYKEFTLTINVIAENKITPQVDGTIAATDITYGQTLDDSRITGEMKNGNETVAGSFTWADGTVKPDAGDSYQAEWRFTPNNKDKYAEVTGTATLKVNKAAPTGAPRYTEITGDGKTLRDAGLTIDSSTLKPNAGRLEWVNDEGSVLPDDTRVEANVAYRWRFTPDDANYAALTGKISLYHKSEGGGGSGSDNGSSNGGGNGSSGGSSSRSTASRGNKKATGQNLPDYVVKGGTWRCDNAGRWSFSTDHTYTDEWGALLNPYADTSKGQSQFDWFHFEKDSVMTTGWYIDKNGDTFYLNPVSDNTLGRMFTGWNWIDDNGDGVFECYYFQEISDGRRGCLYKGTTTPDGYTVNEKGQWTVNGVVQTKR